MGKIKERSELDGSRKSEKNNGQGYKQNENEVNHGK